jgi:hypothetical protein
VLAQLKILEHLRAARSGIDNVAGESMIDKATKDSVEQRAAKAFSNTAKKKTVTEYEKEQEAIKRNYERLRAERLAREAAKSKEK